MGSDGHFGRKSNQITIRITPRRGDLQAKLVLAKFPSSYLTFTLLWQSTGQLIDIIARQWRPYSTLLQSYESFLPLRV